MERSEVMRFCAEHCADVPAFTQMFVRIWSRLYEDIQLNHHQAGLLVFVGERQHCKMSELAGGLKLSPGAVTQLVDPLVAQGFCVRVPDEQDRRVVLVGVTEKGRSLIERIQRRRQLMMVEVFSSLSRDEAHALMGLIQKLDHELQQLDIASIIQKADLSGQPESAARGDECCAD